MHTGGNGWRIGKVEDLGALRDTRPHAIPEGLVLAGEIHSPSDLDRLGLSGVERAYADFRSESFPDDQL